MRHQRLNFLLLLSICFFVLHSSSFQAQETTPEPIEASPTMTASVTPTASLEPSPEVTELVLPTDAATSAVATSTDTASAPEMTDTVTVPAEATAEITELVEITEALSASPTAIVATETALPLSPEPDLVAIVSEPFLSDSVADWTLGTGWQIVPSEGNYALQGTGNTDFVTYAPQTFTDLAVEAIVQSRQLTAELYLRQTTTESYRLSLSPDGHVAVYRNDVVLATASVASSGNNQWRHIRFSVIGHTLRAAIDDVEVIVTTDAQPLIGGTVAFRGTIGNNSNQTLLVDNVRIWVQEEVSSPTPGILEAIEDFGTAEDGSNIILALGSEEGYPLEQKTFRYDFDGLTLNWWELDVLNDPTTTVEALPTGGVQTNTGTGGVWGDSYAEAIIQDTSTPTDMRVAVTLDIASGIETFDIDFVNVYWGIFGNISPTEVASITPQLYAELYGPNNALIETTGKCFWDSQFGMNCLAYQNSFSTPISGVQRIKVIFEIPEAEAANGTLRIQLDNFFIDTTEGVPETSVVTLIQNPIVFVSEQGATTSIFDDNQEIYLATGSTVQNLTNDPNHDTSPVFSPDGSQIAFQSNRTGNWDIYVMDVDGTNIRQLTMNVANDEDPTWSPDGTRVAFVRGNSIGAVYIVGALGEMILSSPTGGDISDLAWSPDGRWIMYVQDSNLYSLSVHCDTNCITPLTVDGTASVPYEDPAWAPSGEQIVINKGGDLYIATVTYDTNSYPSKPNGLTNWIAASINTPNKETNPSWSIDETTIVFDSDREGYPHIYQWVVGTSTATKLAEGGFDAQISPEVTCYINGEPQLDDQGIGASARRNGILNRDTAPWVAHACLLEYGGMFFTIFWNEAGQGNDYNVPQVGDSYGIPEFTGAAVVDVEYLFSRIAANAILVTLNSPRSAYGMDFFRENFNGATSNISTLFGPHPDYLDNLGPWTTNRMYEEYNNTASLLHLDIREFLPYITMSIHDVLYVSTDGYAEYNNIIRFKHLSICENFVQDANIPGRLSCASNQPPDQVVPIGLVTTSGNPNNTNVQYGHSCHRTDPKVAGYTPDGPSLVVRNLRNENGGTYWYWLTSVFQEREALNSTWQWAGNGTEPIGATPTDCSALQLILGGQ